jgi:RNA polymerase sigma-70 factor (ECF subfamily)
VSTQAQTLRFEAVYAETYEQILGYVVRRCPSSEDAADVVAETYATAWRRIDALPHGEEARLWLYGVARKTLANHRRGQARRQRRSGESSVAELNVDIADLYSRTPESTVELGTIARTFRELRDDDRELLSLVAWEGLDHAQIAMVMGVSRNAVRIRLHRARKRFSQALTGAGVIAHHFAMESA